MARKNPQRSIENPSYCTCFRVRRAARGLTQRYDAALAVVGLRSTQFTLLAALEGEGPMPLGRLASALGMDRTTLTRNLRPLERSGLVASRPGDDRRSRWLEVTAAGRRQLKKALPLWRDAQAEVVGALGTSRWNALLDQLVRIGE